MAAALLRAIQREIVVKSCMRGLMVTIVHNITIESYLYAIAFARFIVGSYCMLKSTFLWLKYLHEEKILAGVVLLVTTLLTLAVVNIGYYEDYDTLVHMKLSLAAGGNSISMSLLHVVNDVLMVVFFFHVGIAQDSQNSIKNSNIMEALIQLQQ